MEGIILESVAEGMQGYQLGGGTLAPEIFQQRSGPPQYSTTMGSCHLYMLVGCQWTSFFVDGEGRSLLVAVVESPSIHCLFYIGTVQWGAFVQPVR